MKVIENFLEEEYFNKLTNLICSTNSGFPWFYGQYYEEPYAVETSTHVSDMSANEDQPNYFFTHVTYSHYIPRSPHYELLIPLCDKIEKEEEGAEGKLNEDKHHKDIHGIKALLRMRVNYFPNTNPLYEYPMHADYLYSHTAAILSLNTCDGYTKLADGTKLDSVANRLVLFDAGENHCATTTTNEKARFNLIMNYI